MIKTNVEKIPVETARSLALELVQLLREINAHFQRLPGSLSQGKRAGWHQLEQLYRECASRAGFQPNGDACQSGFVTNDLERLIPPQQVEAAKFVHQSLMFLSRKLKQGPAPPCRCYLRRLCAMSHCEYKHLRASTPMFTPAASVISGHQTGAPYFA